MRKSAKPGYKILSVIALSLALTACTATAAQDTGVLQNENTYCGEDIASITADSILMFFEPQSMYIQQHEKYSIFQYMDHKAPNLSESYESEDSGVVYIPVTAEASEDFETPSGCGMVSIFISNTLTPDELWDTAVGCVGFGTDEKHTTSYYSDNLQTTVELFHTRHENRASTVTSCSALFRYGSCVYCLPVDIPDWDEDSAIAAAKELTENVADTMS